MLRMSAPTDGRTTHCALCSASRVGWIHAENRLSRLHAFELLSKVAEIHLTEMVDPSYLVVAGIDARHLPSR